MNISRKAGNDEIIVTEHRPGFRIVIAFVMMGLVCLAGLFSYGFGFEKGKKTDEEEAARFGAVQEALDSSLRKKLELQYKVANLELANNVDSLATNELLNTVQRLEVELADLKGEISYYRNLFRPELVTGDLLIEGWQLKSLGESNVYEYRLMLTQMSKDGDLVSGSVDIEIQGERNGVEVSVPLEPVLDSQGHCQDVDKYEPGLLLTEINEKADFEGYTDKNATEKKIMRNVFKQGDAYLNTGDIIKQVNVGFAFGIPHYQFVDRVGDTFRWKGQNVSTNEVGEIINQFNQIEFSNVYGVTVPGTDGCAGMAAISANSHKLDLPGLSAHINEALPNYARPLFLRILLNMDTTQTFKMKKGDLREEAFHPDKCTDDIYVLKPSEARYVPLESEFYNTILEGEAGY